MKELALSVLVAVMTANVANADITVNFRQVPEDGKVVAVHLLLSDMQKSRAERRAATVVDTLSVENGKLVMPLADGATQYSLTVGDKQNQIRFFAAPGENIVIDVNSLSPFSYSMKGSELVEGIQTMDDKIAPIMEQVKKVRSQENADNKALEALSESYVKIFKDFIAANPNSTATPYAAMNLHSEDFINAFDNLSDAAKTSIVMPLVTAQYESVKKRQEQNKKQQALQSGDVDAPGFTLKNPEGKDVSLADFRGKWVILDFWGTWCPWCIKGFPALKEAYKKYEGKLEIIGIDCGDKQEQWKNGLTKYELPWVQVYKPETETKVLEDYYVQGFPTKVIVSPEGKIMNITVGENPDFFNTLAKLIGE